MKKEIALPDYNVELGPIGTTLAQYLAQHTYSKICVLVDEHTKLHCIPLIEEVLSGALLIEIKSGEHQKTLDSCRHIWSSMVDGKMDRHSLMINLGGGVIGDMGGYAASCYMRGIDFIQIPTTLLSQVDASVGGKLAIDFMGYKNFIGLFANPSAVLVDPSFLETLSHRELRSGYAEMIKHGLIQNKEIWDRLLGLGDWRKMDWYEEIYQSIKVKKEVVTIDPKESGLRKILNFGHTIGHAIESIALTTNQPLQHGEAIGFGMMAEAHLSVTKNGLPLEKAESILNYLKKIYTDAIIGLMRSDKKNKGGEILFALLDGIGSSTYDVTATDQEIEECLRMTHKWM